MTSDDRWIDMTTFDEELDRLLSGAPPSPEAAAWCSDVAVLVRTARAPARADELAGEDDIVARMRALRLDILAGEASDDAPADDVTAAPLVLVTADAGEDDLPPTTTWPATTWPVTPRRGRRGRG